MVGKPYEAIKEVVWDEVKTHFRPEFLNRIDEVVVFHALQNTHIEKIVTIQIARLAKRLLSQEMQLEVSEAALAELARSGFDPVFGARPLKRAIQQQLENPIAKRILQGKFGPKDVVPVDYKDGQFIFERTLQ
jgi:ATP-dependent Clp protease ATP-binding subunit ClpB